MISWYLKVGGLVAVCAVIVMLYLKAEYYKHEVSVQEDKVAEVTRTLETAKGKIVESQESIKILENGNKSLETRVFEAEGMLSTCAKGYDKLREDLGKAKNVPKQKVAEYYGIDFESGAALLRQYNADLARLRSKHKD